jgi:hypothetical protein
MANSIRRRIERGHTITVTLAGTHEVTCSSADQTVTAIIRRGST